MNGMAFPNLMLIMYTCALTMTQLFVRPPDLTLNGKFKTDCKRAEPCVLILRRIPLTSSAFLLRHGSCQDQPR